MIRMTRQEQLDDALAILREINAQTAALVARADGLQVILAELGLTAADLSNDNDRDTKEATP